MASFSVAPELSAVVRPGVLRFAGALVVELDARLDAPLGELEARVRAQAAGDATAEADAFTSALRSRIEDVRTMYKRVGLDPTRRRPSSEALLRRVRRGDPFPRVNSMVDVCNWCSLEFQLPYGLYDADRLTGDVVLRLGQPGESYAGIRKDDVHVAGRITLADARGPFGNPTSDSARTMVTTGTTQGLLVVFAPALVTTARLDRVMATTAERIHAFTGAQVTRALG